MRIATKLGSFTIIQAQPPDDGDAAIYHLRSPAREALEHLLQSTGLAREIVPPSSPADSEYRVIISRNEIFDILSALAESIDYDHFDPGDQSAP